MRICGVNQLTIFPLLHHFYFFSSYNPSRPISSLSHSPPSPFFPLHPYVCTLVLMSITSSLDLYCKNCAVWESPPDQISSPMDTICHLEPDPWSMGIHPVSQGCSQENLPPLWVVSRLHHDFVPTNQQHCPQVDTVFTWERSRLRWRRRDWEIKCNGHIFIEAITSLSVNGWIWAAVAADWTILLGLWYVLKCVLLFSDEF